MPSQPSCFESLTRAPPRTTGNLPMWVVGRGRTPHLLDLDPATSERHRRQRTARPPASNHLRCSRPTASRFTPAPERRQTPVQTKLPGLPAAPEHAPPRRDRGQKTKGHHADDVAATPTASWQANSTDLEDRGEPHPPSSSPLPETTPRWGRTRGNLIRCAAAATIRTPALETLPLHCTHPERSPEVPSTSRRRSGRRGKEPQDPPAAARGTPVASLFTSLSQEQKGGEERAVLPLLCLLSRHKLSERLRNPNRTPDAITSPQSSPMPPMAASASVLTLPRLSMSPPMPARASPTTTMMMRRTRPLRAACAYTLQEGQSRRSHRLPCGLDLEVIAQQPPTPAPTPGRSERPPLVFVHGSFHAAWCWAERWLPFFSRAGFPCFALSLRAQGESSIPSDTVAGTLETHTGDIADFIRKEVPVPPILIGHSFGGLIVQQYISCLQGSEPLHPKLSGAVLVCSVPPSGNSGLVWRYLLTKPIAAIKVTLSLAAKVYANSLPLCKETFFSSQMDDELVLRYQNLMKESSKLPLFDLRKLNASLPVPSATDGTLEVLVMGASNDFIVDAEGLYETARFYNVQPVCVEGVAHDMMLDCSWEKGAEIILSWLDKLAPRSA